MSTPANDQTRVFGPARLRMMPRKRYLLFAFLAGAAVLAAFCAAIQQVPGFLSARPTPTPGPEPTVSVMRYRDPYLGFAVDYPLGWGVTNYQEPSSAMGPSLAGVEFRSNVYAGNDQAYGAYGITVVVREAMGRALTETVEYRLKPIIPEVRSQIKSECCARVGGEPAIELAGLPWGRWGSRQIVVTHTGREYWLTFYPTLQFNTPSDVTARAAFDTFLQSFTFIPITLSPTPTITPVPTPTVDWGSASPEEQGMDSGTLARMLDFIEDEKINPHSLLVIRNGYLVTEAFFYPYTPDRPHQLASVTKTVTGMGAGIAIDTRRIQNAGQTLVSFYPDRTIANLDALKQSITPEHLLSMTDVEIHQPFRKGVYPGILYGRFPQTQLLVNQESPDALKN